MDQFCLTTVIFNTLYPILASISWTASFYHFFKYNITCPIINTIFSHGQQLLILFCKPEQIKISKFVELYNHVIDNSCKLAKLQVY